MKMRIAACTMVVALGLVALPATSVSATEQSFQLNNHPDGNAQPPPYGLRLDFGDQNNLFFFDNVVGVMDTVTNALSISGTVSHGTEETGIFSGQVFQLNAEILFTSVIDDAVINAMTQVPPSAFFARLD